MEKLLSPLLIAMLFISCQKEMSINNYGNTNDTVNLIKSFNLGPDSSTLVYDDLKRLISWKYYDNYYEAYNVMNYVYSGTSLFQKQIITKQEAVINSVADCSFDSDGRITSRIEQKGVKAYYKYFDDLVVITSVDSNYREVDSLFLKNENMHKYVKWAFVDNMLTEYRIIDEKYDQSVLNPYRYLWNYYPTENFLSKNLSISYTQKVQHYQDGTPQPMWEEKVDFKYELDNKGRVIQIETIEATPEITRIKYY